MDKKVIVSVTMIYPGPLGGAVFLGTDVGGVKHRFVANSNKLFRVPIKGEVWALNQSL